MFLFARKTKTPISTYTDSYRPPNTLKKTFEEQPLALWTENKFITQGQYPALVRNLLGTSRSSQAGSGQQKELCASHRIALGDGGFYGEAAVDNPWILGVHNNWTPNTFPTLLWIPGQILGVPRTASYEVRSDVSHGGTDGQKLSSK
ncbi:hypothetical protein JRQ81_013081 [Phrynocephalus forsythii]|uniref:Uncharacterized protein n=1 Tax=Phrynocephalus forsythii TaxID=171643 RepID=A0A9Q0XYF7_9SAUR|nr:hypothetical protein JRQ81_013081 [Phrynocephalus forsythii]